jgi:hypothetical protein
MSISTIATWLLHMRLADLNVACMRAAVASEEAGRPRQLEADIQAFLREYKDSLEYRSVDEMLGRRGFKALRLYARILYRRHTDAFQLAVIGMSPLQMAWAALRMAQVDGGQRHRSLSSVVALCSATH